MANYEAVIKLIVNGEAALTAVKKEVEDLYKTIGKIEKAGLLNNKAAEATLVVARQHANELERAAQATLKQIKQNEQRVVQQSRLNAAVDLYERRLTQATNSGASSLKKFEGQIGQIEKAFSFFKDRKNVSAVQALATELGRMVEYSNTVNRNERARAAALSQLRGFAKQLADYELQGLNTAEAREKFDKLAVVAGTNQLNEVKKYTEALTRQLQLLKEKATLQAQQARDTAALQSGLGRLEEEQRQLENSKLDQKALQIQAALDKQAAAAAETAAQTAKLNKSQLEFTERTDAAARAANRQTAEYLRMQRVAREVAKINEVARPAQLLLPAAAPGSPAMSGGARSLITGPVERLGGARSQDQADTALRFAQALKEQVRPLSQLEPLYAGIYEEASKLQQVKALPSTEMLNAAVRGIKQLETAEDKLNRERQESSQRLRELDRLEESRLRRARKLQGIRDYNADVKPGDMGNAGFGMQGPGVAPGGVKKQPTGIAGLLSKPGVGDALMGAGFPLLFGAGPGATLGGGIGGFLGGSMGAAGGPMGMALGIALSAVGQILDQTFVKVADLSKAVNALNMDKLRESTIVVNAELDYQVSLLKKAGEADAARAAIGKAIFQQTGLTTGATEAIANSSNLLSNAWDGVVGAVGGFVSILASSVIPAILPVLKLVEMIFKGWNMLLSITMDLAGAAAKWVLNLVLGKDLAEKVLNFFKGTNEESEQVAAALAKANDEQAKVTQRAQQALAIEKMRTNNVTLMGKLINVEADRRGKINEAEQAAADKRKAALDEFGAVESAWAKEKLANILKEIEGEKQVAVQTANLLALRQRELAINTTLVEQDKVRIALMQQQEDVQKARDSATAAVIGAQTQELEQRKQFAVSLGEELAAVNAIAVKKKEAAELAFAAAQREAASKIQIAAADLASIEAQRQRGLATDQQVESARNLYNTTVLTSQENLRGAAATQAAAASAASLEQRQQTVTAYARQYADETNRATNSLNEASNAIANRATVTQALAQAQIAVNNTAIQGLQAQLDATKDLSTRAVIIEKIRQLEIANAVATLRATQAQIDAEVARQEIAYKIVQVKYKELEAVVALAKAQGVMSREYQQALDNQKSALNIAKDNLKTSRQVASANLTAADAVYRGAVNAANLKAQTSLAAGAAGKYAGSMNSAADAAERAAGVQLRGFSQLEPWMEAKIAQAKQGASSGPGSSISSYYAGVNAEIQLRTQFEQILSAQRNQANKKAEQEFWATAGGLGFGKFAEGGYVTRPTLGLVGEGGEPEYIIPRSKMATAASNYLSGSRGAGIMEGSGGDSAVINVQTGPVMEMNGERYVTMGDFERGLRQVAGSVYKGLRTPAGRYAVGVR